MEDYSSIKKKKLLMDTTSWMNLKGIIPSKRNQTQKEYVLIHVTM